MWVPWAKTLNVLSRSLRIAEIFGFSELSVHADVVLLKTFPQHFELCLYEEVMKFYNLGDKTFETDFSEYNDAYLMNDDHDLTDF